MDANESALNQYQKELCDSDKVQDWKDDYIEELLHEDGEYYPFKPENFQEAIAELDLGQSVLVAAYAHVAAKMPSQSANTNFAKYATRITREYWRKAAEKKADIDYDNYYQELKE